jgi:hypothetical protein
LAREEQGNKIDSLSSLNVQAIFSRSLRSNMSEKDPEQRIIMLFSDYQSLLRHNGMGWLINGNPKMASSHITDALKPSIPFKPVKDDLNFGHTNLKKDFMLCMQRCIRRAEQFAEYEDADSSTSNPSNTPGTKVAGVALSSANIHVAQGRSPGTTPARSSFAAKIKDIPD